MMIRARRPRFSVLALVAAAAVLLVTLAMPAPADAWCRGCALDLFCVGGATCYIIEVCEKDMAIVFEACHVDGFGTCHTSGSHCLLAETQPADGIDLLSPVTSQASELVCGASKARPSSLDLGS